MYCMLLQLAPVGHCLPMVCYHQSDEQLELHGMLGVMAHVSCRLNTFFFLTSYTISAFFVQVILNFIKLATIMRLFRHRYMVTST